MAENDDVLRNPLSEGLAESRQSGPLKIRKSEPALDSRIVVECFDPEAVARVEEACNCNVDRIKQQDDRWNLQLSIWRESAS
jgi:hypothetical protein